MLGSGLCFELINVLTYFVRVSPPLPFVEQFSSLALPACLVSALELRYLETNNQIIKNIS